MGFNSGIFGIKKPFGFKSAGSITPPSPSLLNGLTASYSLNGNALKNVGTNNGTSTNVVWDYAVFDKGGIFNGTSNVSIADSSDFTFGSNNWAYSINIKRSVINSRQIFTGQSNNVGSTITVSWWLEFNAINEIVFIGTNGTTLSPININTGYTITDTNWHNIIVQRVGNNIEIYVDAALINATTPFSPGDTINNSIFNWGIGNAGALGILQFIGQIDEVNLWNGRNLTSQEINNLQTQCYPFNSLTFETETNAYVAELSPAPNLLTQVIYNQFFLNLKGSGVTGTYNNLAEIDRLWIFANAAQQNARVSMVNPASTQVTEVNAPSWTQLKGYTGNATTQYINTNFTPSTDAVKFTQTSASVFYYSLTDLAVLMCEVGALSGSNKSFVSSRSATNQTSFPLNVNTGIGSPTSSNANSLGLYHVELQSGTLSLYKQGSLSLPQASITPEPVNNIPFWFLAVNDGASGLLFSSRQLAIGGFGSGLIDQASFNQAIQNIASSLGFKV